MFRTKDIMYPPIVKFKNDIKNIKFKKELIDLSQAVPSYPMPYVIKEKLVEDFSFYTPDVGLDDLRKEIIKLYDLDFLNVDNLIVTAGANQGAYSVFSTLLKKGDTLLLPLPSYFNYDMGAKLLEANVNYYKLKKEKGYRLDLNDIKDSDLKKAKAIVIINPNNPTGAEYGIKDLKALYKKCLEFNTFMIVDEAYGFFAKKPYPESSILTHIKNLDKLILVNTFSKTFSLTGYRIGYVLASKSFLNEMIKVQDTLIICAPRVSQMAAFYGLKYANSWLKEKKDLINKNLEIFRNEFKRLKNFRLLSSGNFFSYIEHGFKDSYTASKVLAEEQGILALPGTIFDKDDTKTLRLAFGNIREEKEILELIDRLNLM
jgi:aspartate/methionine/tyrosine aminotransferase